MTDWAGVLEVLRDIAIAGGHVPVEWDVVRHDAVIALHEFGQMGHRPAEDSDDV